MSIARFRRFAWIVLGITLGVVVWGAFVRASGSGAGCGSHWPTCNGEVIPRAASLETIVEFFHRITSGIITLLVGGQLFWAFRAFPKGHPARRAAAASAAFLVTEALIGARLVLRELVTTNASLARAGWMSVHLVNTFLLLGSLTLTAWFADSRPPRLLRPQRSVTPALSIGLAGTILVGMTGALAALGDTLFPARSLAEGFASDLTPAAHALVRVRVVHPIIAIVVGGYLIVAAAMVASRFDSGREPERAAVRSWSTLASRLTFAQLALGALNLSLLAPIWAQLLHLLMADLVWIALVVLTAASLEVAQAGEMSGERTASAGAA